IQAKDAGADLISDTTYPFNEDIKGGKRRAANWDIGADEYLDEIYYSVGTNTANLNASNYTVQITGGHTATFSGVMPENIGVGDRLDYAGNVAYIAKRNSSTVYLVQTATGKAATNCVAGTNTTVKRAFNSLSSAVGNAYGASYLNTLDLVSANVTLNFACYADGVDTARLTIDYYLTGKNNFIKIFTPRTNTEVGTSQRHNGVWDSSKYNMQLAFTGSYISAVYNVVRFLKFDGIQIAVSNAGNHSDAGAISAGFGVDSNNATYISNCIIKNTTPLQKGYGILTVDADIITYIYNNIIYGFQSTVPPYIYGGIKLYYNPTSYIYNNTIVDCYYGITGGSNQILKNNIVLNSNTCLSGAFNSESNYNIVSDNTASGANSKNNATVKFIDTDNYNYHLSGLDRSAKYAGVDLSADWYYPVSTDIDGETRGKVSAGADEYGSRYISLTATANNATVTIQKGSGYFTDDFKIVFSETDAGISTVQKGRGDGTWRDNQCLATSLLVQTDSSQLAATGNLDVLQNNTTEIIIRNSYNSVVETYHVYSTGKIVIDAVGNSGALTFDSDFTVNTSALRNGGGGYIGMVELNETSALSVTDYNTPDDLSVGGKITTGSLETTRRFDYNTNGFEEGQGEYCLNSANNQLNYKLDGTTTKRFKPAFMLEEFYPQIGDAIATAQILFHSRLDSAADVTAPQKGVAGTVEGTTDLASGMRGNGAMFDADGEYLSISAIGNINSATGTFEFWYKPTYVWNDGVRHALWGYKGATLDANDYIFEKTAANTLYFALCDNAGTEHSITFNLSADWGWVQNGFMHFRVVFDDIKGIMKLFFNGIEKTPAVSTNLSDWSANRLVNANNFAIGNDAQDTTAEATGIIDDFYIYNDCILPYGAYFTDMTNSYANPNPDILFYFNCESDVSGQAPQIGNGTITIPAAQAVVAGVNGNGLDNADTGSNGIQISVANNLDLNKGRLGFWWYPKEFQTGCIIYVDARFNFNYRDATYMQFKYQDGNIVGGTNALLDYTSMPVNKWYWIELVWEKNVRASIYVDGILKGNITPTGTMPTGATLYVSDYDLNVLSCVVDELYISSNPDTPQIQTAFGKPIRYPQMYLNGTIPVRNEGFNIAATPCAASYMAQTLTNITLNSTYVFDEADTIAPEVTSATILDTDNDGNVNELMVTFSENMKDSSMLNADAARFTFGGTALTAIDSTTDAVNGTNPVNSRDP
ncbi:MAG: hypothetical protein ACD_79C00482G0001, partial [uncultured bacterium]